MSYEKALREALEAALEAGEYLRREFHRWGGPAGHYDHADADLDAEWLIRNRLTAAFPEYRYRGEETGTILSDDPHVWLIDPNDGTIGYLKGARGTAVSIGLVRDGIPVLGVVYAYVAPDDRGDLIYWAEGFELTRNGVPVKPVWNAPPSKEIVLLVSMHRDTLIEPVLDCIHPYRYRTVPSVAYRLALAAVGEGSVAVSWHNPGDWDYAGGHALLRAAGGVLLNEAGKEVTYAADGASKVKRCFGGDPRVARDLWRRDWEKLQQRQLAGAKSAATPSRFPFARPIAGKAIFSTELLSRAQGCLLGQVAGDSLGSLVEFASPEKIADQYPRGVCKLEDGGVWNTLAGQPTDDSELALLLARTIVQHQKYDPSLAADSYRYWLHETHPFDVGNATRTALSRHADFSSQANGSLMRISPLGIYGYRKDVDELWDLACAESRITHPHSICQQACALFVYAIAEAIRTGNSAEALYRNVYSLARKKKVDAFLLQALGNAELRPPAFLKNQGHVLIAFQNAMHRLLNSGSLEKSVVDTVACGGDTDTNAAITGALTGAVFGRDAIPDQWRRMILSCRPYSRPHVAHPRPLALWPVDLLLLSEMLLLAG